VAVAASSAHICLGVCVAAAADTEVRLGSGGGIVRGGSGAQADTEPLVGDWRVVVLDVLGRRVGCPVAVNAPIAALSLSPRVRGAGGQRAAGRLLVLTVDGALEGWDVEAQRRSFAHSVRHLASAAGISAGAAAGGGASAGVRVRESPEGVVLLTTAGGDSYALNEPLGQWVLVAEPARPAPASLASLFRAAGAAATGGTLQMLLAAASPAAAAAASVAPVGGAANALGDLESLLAATAVLRSPAEHRLVLRAYALELGRRAPGAPLAMARLLRLLDSLAGPLCSSIGGSLRGAGDGEAPWEPEVLGLRKHELLTRDVLPVLALVPALGAVVEGVAQQLAAAAAGAASARG
jgi:hypothetical protein